MISRQEKQFHMKRKISLEMGGGGGVGRIKASQHINVQTTQIFTGIATSGPHLINLQSKVIVLIVFVCARLYVYMSVFCVSAAK